MGERVTGVRVTPISGALVARGAGLCGRIVCAVRGSTGAAEVMVGGAGGGAARLLVVGAVADSVVAVVGDGSTGVAGSSAPPGLPMINRTAQMTSAAAAAATTINTVSDCLRRYQGGGSGSKYQVSASNASNAPLSRPDGVGGASSGVRGTGRSEDVTEGGWAGVPGTSPSK
jgi:hypothetical protein